MACEKCWGDAYLRWMVDPEKSQAEHYRELLAERKETPCSRREALGQFAGTQFIGEVIDDIFD